MSNPMPAPELDPFPRRQQRLLTLAWTATVLPLIAFGYLTWQSWDLAGKVQVARQDVAAAIDEAAVLERRKQALESQIMELDASLEAQRASAKHYRDLTGIRIQFYRESDRAVVDKALERLGFKVDTNLGVSRLIDARPDTIAFGTLVADQDLREIAVALVEAGFPLKRIAPAVTQRDPKLIQIYASVETDRRCGLLSVEQIRAGLTCGPR